MVQQPDNQNDRLEGLLRQWGNDEAEQHAQPPAAPGESHRPKPVIWMARVRRWAPLAAAAVLLAAAGELFYRDTHPRPPAQPAGAQAPPASSPAVAHSTSRPVDPELMELRRRAADLEAQLAAANAKLAELPAARAEAQKLKDQIDRLQTAHQAELASQTGETARQKKNADQLAARLQTAQQDLAESQATRRVLQATADELPAAQKQADDLRKRLAAAGEELARKRKAEEAAEAALAQAKLAGQRLEVQHREIVAAFQRTYLASVAPNQTGLEARKTAVRARHMLDRLAKLSPEVRTESTRQLVESLEAVLTRLDLMNPNRPGNEELFRRLLRQGDLERQIDAALAAPDQPQDVRNWLFEAKLIVMGADHAR